MGTWKSTFACFCWSCPLYYHLFLSFFFFFLHLGGRFGDGHLKVPKTTKTLFSGTLPGKGSNWSNICKHEELASVGLLNIPLGVPARCILLYRPKLKKCVPSPGKFLLCVIDCCFVLLRGGDVFIMGLVWFC